MNIHSTHQQIIEACIGSGIVTIFHLREENERPILLHFSIYILAKNSFHWHSTIHIDAVLDCKIFSHMSERNKSFNESIWPWLNCFASAYFLPDDNKQIDNEISFSFWLYTLHIIILSGTWVNAKQAHILYNHCAHLDCVESMTACYCIHIISHSFIQTIKLTTSHLLWPTKKD